MFDDVWRVPSTLISRTPQIGPHQISPCTNTPVASSCDTDQHCKYIIQVNGYILGTLLDRDFLPNNADEAIQVG